MAVIITNMEIPQNCSKCRYHNGCGCCDFGDDIRVDYETTQRPLDCPIKASDNSILEDINKMIAEINGEIACAEYHEVECNHKTERQIGRKVIAKIVHKYCDKYMKSEDKE